MLRIWLIGSMLLALSTSAVAAGCGGSTKRVVAAGRMPEGGSFEGVWFSPQYGRMDMIQNGDTVLGEYSKDERTGTLQGDVEGDMLRFSWEEKRALISNRPTSTKGHGYFRYRVDPNTEEHKILGRWGLGDNDNNGGPWNGVKSKRLTPELKSQKNAHEEDYGAEEDEAEEEPSDVLGGGIL
ncbi:MAG: hypothetical protein MJD61_21585 [Proteobacteria bacterium]|nr:hypothetical protein [Pseudomonadota bacterium]